MELNSRKNIAICQKALYSKQLAIYASLCSIYSDLAKLQGPKATSEDIERIYAKPLSLAVKGDLDFDKVGLYEPSEISLFNRYAAVSKRFQDFRKASELLEKVIEIDEESGPVISVDGLLEFEDYMDTTSKSTQSFIDDIHSRSRSSISLTATRRTNTNLQAIQEIDPSHLPENIKLVKPADYGLTIDKKATLEKNRTNTKYKSHHGLDLKKLVVTLGAAALITLGVSGAIHTYNAGQDFRNLSISSEAPTYEQHISQKTLAELERIEQIINNARTSTTLPTHDELLEIRNSLDGAYDIVISDLVTEAFQEQNPGCRVKSVETEYDKTTNRYTTSASEPKPEEFVHITYLDKKGEENTITVTDFTTIFFADNPLQDSFENEYDLDHSYPRDFENDTTTSFDARTNYVIQKLDYYEGILQHIKHLAAVEMDGNLKTSLWNKFFGNYYLKTTLPEKLPQTEEKQENPTIIARNDSEDLDER